MDIRLFLKNTLLFQKKIFYRITFLSLFKNSDFAEIFTKATFEKLPFPILHFCHFLFYFGVFFPFLRLLYFSTLRTKLSFHWRKKQWQSKTHTSSPSTKKS